MNPKKESLLTKVTIESDIPNPDKADIEKLKKVEKILTKKKIWELIDNINQAYKTGPGYKVDEAIKEYFDLLDSFDICKDSGSYLHMKNHTWQKNHLKIIACTSNLMQRLLRMPSTTEIATESKLSEETIYKHFKELKNHELYKHENDKYLFLTHSVLTAVFNLAVQGNVKACKVYLDYFGQSPKILNETNNFIQINNTVIKQADFEQLDSKKQSQILSIISKAKIQIPNQSNQN